VGGGAQRVWGRGSQGVGEGLTGCGGGAHRVWGRGSQGVREGLQGVGEGLTECRGGAHRVWGRGSQSVGEGLTECGGVAQGVGLTEYGMVLTKCLCRTGSFSFSSFISFLNAPPENTVIQFFHP